MPGFPNPFYSSSSPKIPPAPGSSSRPGRSDAPPSYSSSTGPTSSAPAQYGSLADLTRGQQRPVPPPPPGRPYNVGGSKASSGAGGAAGAGAAYGSSPYSSTGANRNQGQGQGQGQEQYARYGDGRNMPPPPGNYGRGVPDQPPRRNVAGAPLSESAAQTQPAPSGISSYIPAGAQGYANTASSYASAGVNRARDGIDSVFTQQNRDKVASGVAGAAATGAKLLGKGAWQLGKFAANGGKS